MTSRRLLLLFAAGMLILGLVVFRERQLAYWRSNPVSHRGTPRQLAPRFRVADHNKHVVKFERFLGRQRVILLFFDAKLGAESDPHLQALARCAPDLQKSGIEIIAISDASPHANREAEKKRGEKFPFPLLTDIDLSIPASSPVHRLYGLYDWQREVSTNGLFLIARDGTVPIGPDGKPFAVADVGQAIEELCAGNWPQ